MEYLIKPHEGFLIKNKNMFITLGTQKEIIHKQLDSNPSYIMETLEYYDELRVDYNENDEAVAFEFFSNADVFLDSTYSPKITEKNLFKISFSELNELLIKIDPQSKVSGAGVISLNYGLGTYLEDAEDDRCESIIIFKKGYYDSLGW